MKLLKEKLLKCKHCTLCENRENVVIGLGNKHASILFIGGTPKEEEEEYGKSFTKESKKILNELFLSVGLSCKDIYLTNIVKCRPLDDRKPTQLEIKICQRYLDEEIFKIKPKVICTIGREALNFVKTRYGLGEITTINEMHGKIFPETEFVIIPLYHPIVTLKNSIKKKELLLDLKIVKKYASV
jgi:DNA polymerase